MLSSYFFLLSEVYTQHDGLVRFHSFFALRMTATGTWFTDLERYWSAPLASHIVHSLKALRILAGQFLRTVWMWRVVNCLLLERSSYQVP